MTLKHFHLSFLFSFLLFLCTGVGALEVEEKLTLRILNTSASAKTILINRGEEDGLVKGNHAMFYLSAGVVARGVVIDVSPTRSVWSLYRLVNANYIKADEVMRLKITEPVKITQDPTRNLVSDDVPVRVRVGDPRDLGIPLAPGADDLESYERDRGTLQEEGTGENYRSELKERVFEVFGNFHYSTQSIRVDNGVSSSSGTESELSIDGGLEYFFKDEEQWYSRFGLLGLLGITNRSTSSDGASFGSNVISYGAGVNWYPWTLPHTPYTLIPFAQFSFRMGTLQSTTNDGSNSGDVSGSLTQMSLGMGLKLYSHQGWGAGLKFDYLSRSESYSSDVSSKRASSGPKLSWLLFYRF